MITYYHASYYAHELTRVGGTGVDWLVRILFGSCVDLNPHQQESCEKLFNCNGRTSDTKDIPEKAKALLKRNQDRHAKATIAKNLEENNRHFNAARDQLDKWAEARSWPPKK